MIDTESITRFNSKFWPNIGIVYLYFLRVAELLCLTLISEVVVVVVVVFVLVVVEAVAVVVEPGIPGFGPR